MLREILHEQDLELASSARPQKIKLIPAPEVCSLSLEMQLEECSATCEVQQGFLKDNGTKGWTQCPSAMECRDAAFSLYIETSVQKGLLLLYFHFGM